MPNQRHSARPDGTPTLCELVLLIPDAQREQLEDDINDLLATGFGELSFVVVRGELDRWTVTKSRKLARNQ